MNFKEEKKDLEIEEEEEEIEVEEIEEEEEDEDKNSEETNLSLQNENLKLEISIELIKEFKELSSEESDESIYYFIQQKGLPMVVNSEETLVLLLYFHKLCVPFYNILNSIDKKDILEQFLILLKENYYLLADTQIKHFNYKSIAQKVYPFLKHSKEKSLISIELCSIPLNKRLLPTPSIFKINRNILELGVKSKGKLDFYSKVHIFNALVNLVNIEDIKIHGKIFQQMEDDLMKLYKKSRKEKMTEEKYNEYVKIFTEGEKRNEWPEIFASIKKGIIIFQNVCDDNSIKIYEKLFIQLLGHFDIEVRNNAVKILNMIYDQTHWQERRAFPIENTKILLIGDELNLE